ncbi:MAG TPA: outer membrane protein assembly factor BamA [Candidatus Sulfopaludibacter sp.]|jgi:outer membrane protein assembly complex protein YaeT|nr:outer membrane protein assembly factor BamA [Candidatus Sulfopaludibacter sp.]
MRVVCRPLASVPRVLLLLALAGLQVGKAQYQKFEGKPVKNIQFSPSAQPLEPDELFQILPLKRGQPLRVADVRASIERLFATGRYADIQVDAEPYEDGAIIRFITTNSWFVGSVTVDGAVSSPPNVSQLENATLLNLGEPYTEAKLADAKGGQERLLEANGLYRPTVRPVLDWESGKGYQQVNIRFDVDSGRRARFTTPILLGDIKMDEARILKATKFQRWLIHSWKPMTQTRVRQGLDGVRSLYEKDNRLEAKVSLDSMKFDAATNTAVPSLRIDAGPRIQIQTIGAKISKGKLRRYIPIYEEHTVDHDLLTEGARNLQDYLESAGYYEAEVEFKEQHVTNDQATIDYLINTGKQHKLVHIEITGDHYFQTETLRERMFLRTASFLQFPHGRYSENLVARDEDTIRNLYQSNGFRDVEVSHSSEDDYQGRNGEIAVFIEIKEGPQYFIQSLTVSGIEKMDKTALLAGLSSSAGQPFSEFNVAVDRDAILARYFEKGFPDATFEWSSKPAADPTRVELSYVIHEGNAQFVRQVIYTGNKVTKDRVINHLLELNPGDPLSPTAITDTQRRLYDLGVFARVDAAIQDPDGETDRKFVLYDLEEAKRFSMAFGFGAEIARIGGCGTCLDAPAGATGFSPRVSVDVARNNLWGEAHNLSLRTRASTIEQQALLTYTWPRFFGNDNLSFSIAGLYDNSRDVRTFSYKREEGSLQLSQRLTKATTVFYRYAYRRVGIDQGTLKISSFLIPLLSQPVLLGQLSTGMIQDHRDDPLDPHRGYYNTIDLGLAEHIFGSQRNFLHFLGRNASYYQLSKRLVLARSTAFGDIYAFNYRGNPLDAVPLAERFFGGGGTSHRGFGENQAGPRDISTGFPIGGTAQLFNQTELRFPLIGENIGGVLFHDMGNTFSSLSNLSFRVKQHDLQDFDYMVHAVGLGVRYRTPIGPVRVDMAYSINPPRFFGFNGSQQDLLNAGVDPCANGSSFCSVRNSGHFQFFFSIGQTF